MQAAQIDPVKTYALRITEPKSGMNAGGTYIARFKVWTVESHMQRRKLKPTSADYTHKVHGHIDERDVPAEFLPAEPEARKAYLKRTVDPSEIEDEYGRYKELVARAEAEKAQREAEEAERNRKAKELVAMFYHFTGVPADPKADHRGSPFATSYAGGIGINEVGVAALLRVLTPNQPYVDKSLTSK